MAKHCHIKCNKTPKLREICEKIMLGDFSNFPCFSQGISFFFLVPHKESKTEKIAMCSVVTTSDEDDEV